MYKPILFGVLISILLMGVAMVKLKDLMSTNRNIKRNNLEQGIFFKKVGLPLLIKDITPVKNAQNIFILETTNMTRIHSRFICSVESYCKTNPEASVYFLLFGDEFTVATVRIMEKLKTEYPNLNILKMDTKIILQDTPMMDKQEYIEAVQKEFFKHELLRLALIYKYGGMTSNLDVIALRNMNTIKNFVVVQDVTIIGDSVFHFTAEHPYIKNILEDLLLHFEVDKFASPVKLYLSTNLERYCPNYHRGLPTSFSAELLDANSCPSAVNAPPEPWLKCDNLDVYDTNAAHMINSVNSERLFTMTAKQLCLPTLLKNALVLHWGNSGPISGMWAYKDSAIETVAEEFCPVTFHNKVSGIFGSIDKN